jgi:F-type H+-transporting ATPase subunit delta
VSVQARPQDYAAAIHDLAVEAWQRKLGALLLAFEDADLLARLDEPGASIQDRLGLLDAAVPGGLDGEPRKFVGTLLEAGQLDQLPAILVELGRLARRRPEMTVARVASAVPLTEDEQDALRARLVERFGADLEFQFAVDPALIGGIHLRVGDQVIDGTVAGKLAALRDRLAA